MPIKPISEIRSIQILVLVIMILILITLTPVRILQRLDCSELAASLYGILLMPVIARVPFLVHIAEVEYDILDVQSN